MSDKAFGLTCDECGAILREFRDAVQHRFLVSEGFRRHGIMYKPSPWVWSC
jgi:hypothetical protein